LKGLKVNEKEGQIIIWSHDDLHMNYLKNGKLKCKYKDLTQSEDFITDVLVHDTYRYFTTSS
jgi:hypothetical protein